MYSVVLMVAVTTGGDTASFGHKGGGCTGYMAGCSGSCHGGGGGFLGGRSGGKHHKGGGCSGSCYGSGYGSCYGTTAAACGCCGTMAAAPVVAAPAPAPVVMP